jgi:hypothetical protein
MTRNSLNQGLSAARAAKQDEFYTQYVDIQKEVEAYLEFDPDTFRDKVVYCNCDDPFALNSGDTILALNSGDTILISKTFPAPSLSPGLPAGGGTSSPRPSGGGRASMKYE